MAREFMVNGRRVVAFRAGEEDAIRFALALLSAWATPQESGEELPFPQCQALLEQLVNQVAPLAATDFLMHTLEGANAPNAVPTYIPEPGDGRQAMWQGVPELEAILTYASGGVLVDAAEGRVLEAMLVGVTSLQQGTCIIRTRWGLVGAVAVLGAAVLAGGSYIYSRAKKPRKNGRR